MTTISQALTYGRKALNQMEAPLVRALLDQYGMAWLHIEERLAEVERYIDLAFARGEVVDDTWLHRQRWWQSTLDSIEVEMKRYTAGMAETLANGEWQALQVAQRVSGGITDYVATEAAKRGITVTGGIRGQVNAPAFERWMLAQQPDSPIREAIDRYGDRASESIRTRMTEGLAAGEHPRTIADRIKAEVGEDATRGQLQTLTRTETHRAYRGALRDSMEAMGPDVIRGWRWTAAKSRRTCVACLAMDGREFEFDQYPDRFHVACRCVVSPLAVTSIIPARPYETGEAWFARQAPAVQRKMLGKGHYAAYQKGSTLGDMTTVKADDVWGDSVAIRPARELAA